MSADDELLALRETFFEEADERISEVEGLLLELEQRPDDAALIAPIFRSIHSLKSGGGACELFELAQFAHRFENLLDQIRHGHMEVRPSTLEVLLKSTDALSALVQKARGYEPRLDQEEVTRVSESISAELAEAGIYSQPPAPALVSADGIEGLVLWDDEPTPDATATEPSGAPSAGPQAAEAAIPVAAEPEPEPEPEPEYASRAAEPPADGEPDAALRAPAERLASESPQAADSAESDVSDATGSEVELDGGQLARLIDLSVELAVASSALQHAVGNPEQFAASHLQELFTAASAHASEIENLLAQLRVDGSSAISDVVCVRAGEQQYFLPVSAIELYFSPEPDALRQLPGLGRVLVWRGQALPLHTLRALMNPGAQASHEGPSVVAILNTRGGRVALEVDEVSAQSRVVVRPLQRELCAASGLLGAAIYMGAPVLVLDPDTLTRSRCGTSAARSWCPPASAARSGSGGHAAPPAPSRGLCS
ncbi:MAG TPA: chemotaxis protein CheW [Polyangiales bacterium]